MGGFLDLEQRRAELEQAAAAGGASTQASGGTRGPPAHCHPDIIYSLQLICIYITFQENSIGM